MTAMTGGLARVAAVVLPAAVLAVCLFSAGATAAQTGTDEEYKAPRTAWGHPDLEGRYTMETFTPLERPAHLAGKEFFTEEEAAELQVLLTAEGVDPLAGNVLALEDEERRQDRLYQDSDTHYDNSVWLRGNTPKGLSSRRTSLVVDPPDGRIPPRTREAERAAVDRREARRGREFESHLVRPLAERCIVWPHEGPPMVPPAYNDILQILQTPDHVVIAPELRTNKPRIIPLDAGPRISDRIRLFQGDPRAWWDGDTLVVESTNFSGKTLFRGAATEEMIVVERFTRVDADTIRYEFTVDDPRAWTGTWSVEIPMVRRDDEMFEYACHEGNYDVRNILLVNRNLERQAAAQEQ
ncbi:MAG: hypothetical protein F4137_13505 [Acidobacteria bacterium]|nr:hypothetical protein [Acidobacteriota bacterium]